MFQETIFIITLAGTVLEDRHVGHGSPWGANQADAKHGWRQ